MTSSFPALSFNGDQDSACFLKFQGIGYYVEEYDFQTFLIELEHAISWRTIFYIDPDISWSFFPNHEVNDVLHWRCDFMRVQIMYDEGIVPYQLQVNKIQGIE